jgi:hypothetical protein
MYIDHVKLKRAKLAVLLAATGALLGLLPSSGEIAQGQAKVAMDQVTAWSLIEQSSQYLKCRAMEAAVWGMPLVNFDAMRQAVFRDVNCGYNDILYQSRVADWKFQVPTPDIVTPYLMFFINTKQDGPVVVEIPPGTENALRGTLIDAWSVPIIDIGNGGEGQGNGKRYLLLPPDYRGAIPAGYIPVHCKTYNSYSLCRLKAFSDEDAQKGIAYLKQLRIYPLSKADAPHTTRFIDISGKLFDGVLYLNASFYVSLSRMINEEPAQEKDLAMLGMLWPLGLEKGKEFKPSDKARAAITMAIPDVTAVFKNTLLNVGVRWWSDRRWRSPLTDIGPKTGFNFETPEGLAVDDRATNIFFFAFGAPEELTVTTLKVGFDQTGQLLRGENSYRLHVPANVPASQFWSVNAYDLETACFIRESPRVGISSFEQRQTNADGSVDLYLGPHSPTGNESNWLPTKEGKGYMLLFRFYGPEESLLDRSWKLNDIVEVK